MALIELVEGWGRVFQESEQLQVSGFGRHKVGGRFSYLLLFCVALLLNIYC